MFQLTLSAESRRSSGSNDMRDMFRPLASHPRAYASPLGTTSAPERFEYQQSANAVSTFSFIGLTYIENLAEINICLIKFSRACTNPFSLPPLTRQRLGPKSARDIGRPSPCTDSWGNRSRRRLLRTPRCY